MIISHQTDFLWYMCAVIYTLCKNCVFTFSKLRSGIVFTHFHFTWWILDKHWSRNEDSPATVKLLVWNKGSFCDPGWDSASLIWFAFTEIGAQHFETSSKTGNNVGESRRRSSAGHIYPGWSAAVTAAALHDGSADDVWLLHTVQTYCVLL